MVYNAFSGYTIITIETFSAVREACTKNSNGWCRCTGCTIWHYYHAQPSANPNASYYDIREHFQGRDGKGRMNAKSGDAQYIALIAALRDAERALGDKIAPKVYEYGFLKE